MPMNQAVQLIPSETEQKAEQHQLSKKRTPIVKIVVMLRRIC